METLHEFPSANAAFPYEAQVAAARRFLESRGIREPKPLYHSFTPERRPSGVAARRARERWFAPHVNAAAVAQGRAR